MRRYTTHLIVGLLMFVIGVAAYNTWTFFYHHSHLEEQIIPVSQLREDNLHRLYEATQMLGKDWDTKNMMIEKLACARADGVIDARMVEKGQETVRCQRGDGTVYELNNEMGLYGVMFNKIRKEHASWSQKNLEFLKRVSTPEKAKAYIHQHMTDMLP